MMAGDSVHIHQERIGCVDDVLAGEEDADPLRGRLNVWEMGERELERKSHGHDGGTGGEGLREGESEAGSRNVPV